MQKRLSTSCMIATLFLGALVAKDSQAQYAVQPGMHQHAHAAMQQTVVPHAVQPQHVHGAVSNGVVSQVPMQQVHGQQVPVHQPQVFVQQPANVVMQSGHTPMGNVQLGHAHTGGSCDHCGYSASNPPAQPQVAAGRCQACTVGVDCVDNCGRAQTVHDLHRYNFQPLAHGEWLGPIRTPSTVDYRVRPRDELRFTYIQSQEVVPGSFKLSVGDEIQVRSLIDDSIAIGSLERGALIQTDGTVHLEQIGGVPAAGKTIEQLEKDLEIAYGETIKNPAISVIPVKTNSPLLSLIDSVDARAGVGGTSTADTVHSDGTITLPRLGQVCVVGMSLSEIKREVNLRYREIVAGLEVEVRIEVEAPHVATVTGEVQTPGVIDLQAPTSVLAGIGRAGGQSSNVPTLARLLSCEGRKTGVCWQPLSTCERCTTAKCSRIRMTSGYAMVTL